MKYITKSASAKKNVAATVFAALLMSSVSYGAIAAGVNDGGAAGSFTAVTQTALFDMSETYDMAVNSGSHNISVEPDSDLPAGVSKQTAELNSRLQLETGHVYSATKTLNALLAQNPNDVSLLEQTANAENYGGNWPYASYLLDRAHSLAPENQDVTNLQQEIRRLHAQGVQADFDWIKYGHSLEDVSALSTLVNATSHVQIGADVKDNYTLGHDVRLQDGRVGDYSANKQQGELFAQYSAAYGQIVKVAAFGNNDTAGGGAYYHFLSPLGETELTGEYHKPYWDLPEAVLDDAVRDRVAFLQTLKPTAHLTIEGGAGVNRYDLSKVDDVLDTISADFNILYRVIDEVKYHKPYVDIGYNINGEYDRSAKYTVDSNGDNSLVLPQHSYEIHTPFVEVGEDFTPSTYGDIAAGWQFDRLGGNGPLVEGKITHELNQAFDVQLRASYGLDTTQSENNITTVGGYLRCRF